MAIPIPLVKIYMSVTPEVLAIAPRIMRTYFVALIFLLFNVFATYYFQAIAKPAVSLGISLTRGMALSGALLFVLPAAFGGDALWLAVPMTEIFVCAFVLCYMRKTLR